MFQRVVMFRQTSDFKDCCQWRWLIVISKNKTFLVKPGRQCRREIWHLLANYHEQKLRMYYCIVHVLQQLKASAINNKFQSILPAFMPTAERISICITTYDCMVISHPKIDIDMLWPTLLILYVLLVFYYLDSHQKSSCTFVGMLQPEACRAGCLSWFKLIAVTFSANGNCSIPKIWSLQMFTVCLQYGMVVPQIEQIFPDSVLKIKIVL